MYFSKKRKFLIAQVIKKSPDLLCRISLDVGWCGLQELAEMENMEQQPLDFLQKKIFRHFKKILCGL